MSQADADLAALAKDLPAQESASASTIADLTGKLAKSQADLTAANLKLTAANLNVDSLTGTVNAQAAKLLAMPSVGQTIDGKGTSLATVLRDNSLVFGGKYIGSIFKAAQKYAVAVGNKSTLIGVYGTSDSGGIRVQGSDDVLIDTVTNGNGQNGLSGGNAVRATIIRATSLNNNLAGYNVLNEAGGGKWAKCSDIRFLDCNFSGNKGVGLWLDVNVYNFLIRGGTYSNNAAADGKTQVANVRVEISSNGRIEQITSAVSGGMNTCVEINDSNNVQLVNNTLTGQWGISKTSRAATNPTHDITVTGNTIDGNGWWFSGIPNLVVDGNTYVIRPGRPLAYIDGKAIPDIATLRQMGYEKDGKTVEG